MVKSTDLIFVILQNDAFDLFILNSNAYLISGISETYNLRMNELRVNHNNQFSLIGSQY